MKVELDSREMTKVMLALSFAYQKSGTEEFRTIHDKLMVEMDKYYLMKMHGGA